MGQNAAAAGKDLYDLGKAVASGDTQGALQAGGNLATNLGGEIDVRDAARGTNTSLAGEILQKKRASLRRLPLRALKCGESVRKEGSIASSMPPKPQ